ncbi:DUF1493 family protein [uncultured Pontibacter sp.]|uniref:DUF1493 family protein n=1 Tax=uncultured Pontibacter sp. TaxID=453356 RepID=UPI002624D373|nr:DUF1493 family protein [uncultured Pontibacter sp.]
MCTVDEVIIFLKEVTGVKKIDPDSDIFYDIGVVGDDFDEMMHEFAEKFSVNMDQYLWYFHGDEEGSMWGIGSFFFAPPYKRVNRIPVTPTLLAEAANKGKWDIQYPDHKLPKWRVDMYIDQVIGIAVLGIAVVSLVVKCSS